MFALRSGRGRLAGTADGCVLPRPLRRPARLLARCLSGEVEPPRHAAGLASLALIAAAGLYGAWLGGHMPTIVGGICTRLGLAVDEVRVTGNRETSEIDLIQSLELDGSTSLIGLDAHAARQRVDRLPWVKTASVRKIYPDAIAIDIEEREPFAVWQNGGRLTIIERSGVPIAPFSGGRHAALPLVLGLGAPEAAADFLSKVSRHPEIAARVRGYIRVGDRRWDLRLENGLTVKLPEHGEEKALAELAAMEEAQAILSRDILTIDMRIEDRVVFKLTPEAALRRNATLEEQRKQERRRHI